MSNDGKRRVGLVGFGSIAENSHLPAWQSLPGVEVVAVADVSPVRLDEARALLSGAALYDSPEELIARADVTTIDICTPPTTHAPLLVGACRRAIPDIVCEKPLVLTEDEYIAVAHARRESGSRIISVNNWAHSDLNRHVTAAVAEGAIGTVRSVELHIGRPDCALGNGGWNPRWRTDLAYAGGGIILDHGWHQFYLLMGWMGENPEAVSATTRTVNPQHHPVEDEAHVEVFFPSGAGTVDLSWTAEGRTNGGTILGDRGRILALDDRVVVENGTTLRELPFAARLSASSYHPDWFRAVFQYNVVTENRQEADRNFAEAGRVVGTVCAAYRSATQGGARCRPTIPEVVTQAERTAETNGRRRGGDSPQ